MLKLFLKLAALVVVCGVLYWLSTSLFIVDAGQRVIVTRFSKPLDTVFEPGAHFKWPWPIDGVIRFDKRLLVFKYLQPTEFLTEDKKNILVDSYAVWQIDDEHSFLATVRNRDGAEARLLDMITAAMGEVVGMYPLGSFINTDAQQVKLDEINQKITALVAAQARKNYGMRVVDIRISNFNFPPQNQGSVIRRMQAERNRIATQYRSEGDEQALKIEAATEFESRKLLAEAKRQAAVIRGEGEAQAMQLYAAAYATDPDFYRFLRTLEAYDKMLDDKTTLILRTDSPLWRLLEQEQ